MGCPPPPSLVAEATSEAAVPFLYFFTAAYAGVCLVSKCASFSQVFSRPRMRCCSRSHSTFSLVAGCATTGKAMFLSHSLFADKTAIFRLLYLPAPFFVFPLGLPCSTFSCCGGCQRGICPFFRPFYVYRLRRRVSCVKVRYILTSFFPNLICGAVSGLTLPSLS